MSGYTPHIQFTDLTDLDIWIFGRERLNFSDCSQNLSIYTLFLIYILLHLSIYINYSTGVFTDKDKTFKTNITMFLKKHATAIALNNVTMELNLLTGRKLAYCEKITRHLNQFHIVAQELLRTCYVFFHVFGDMYNKYLNMNFDN
ncbi:hypothetical protein ACJX0J_014902 [Zea mays]